MIGLELSPGQLFGGVRVSDPFAAFFAGGGGQNVAIGTGLDGGISVWSEVSPAHAACLRLDNADPTTRLSWRETLIAELRNIYPVGALTLAGSWSQLQSSGSGVAGSYTGNRAISTGSLSASASATVGRTKVYDLWIHYTGRTSGGYAKVEIDGAQTLVNEIDDPASLGFKAFSTYAPVDLTRRQSVKVATGLTGSHDVTVSFGAAATPGGAAIMIEAIAISGDLSGPRILPPLWAAGTSYEMGDEVCFDGIYYAARGNGVSGSTAPSHTSGIASDGALDWRADNRPTYPDFVAIDYASEREYAVRFDVGGTTSEVGGQTHGNEPLVSRSITLDGVPWVPQTTGLGLSVGTGIAMLEQTTWQTQAGVAVADCQLTRTITPGSVRHDVDVVGTGPQADVEWFYAGMLPMVRWDGESRTTVVDSVAAPDGPSVNLADYAGVNPANVDFVGATRLGMRGFAKGTNLTYGQEAGASAMLGNGLVQFDAFLRPNLSAASESGSTDWSAKAYVIAGADGGLSFGAGDALGFFNRHVIAAN
jgi:hypothetical protein